MQPAAGLSLLEERTTMLKAVIFDFDGTLADTRYILYKVYDRLARKHNLTIISPDELEEMRSMPIRDRFKKAGVSLLKLPVLIREVLPIYSEYIGSAEPFPDIKELIKHLKEQEFVLSIISSNTVKNINSFLAAHNLQFFDHIRSTSGLFAKHRAIRQALADLGIKSDQAVYVGDELRDITACKKVPIKIISVSWGYDHLSLLREGQPDYIVHYPAEIKRLLPQL